MATAGASGMAGRCGLPDLVVPLLALAVLQAVWIPVIGVLRHRAEIRLGWAAWLEIGPVTEHAGIHTVPLGVAVITGGWAGLSAWPLLPPLLACLAMTWVLTIASVGRFVWSLAARGLQLKAMDGTWFLVPATLLGAAIATEDVAKLMPGHVTATLDVLALASAALGWLGYCAVIIVASARLWRFGLKGAPLAPWWIAMGCAGLAAAALGRVSHIAADDVHEQVLLAETMVATSFFSVALCVPVLLGSALFLLRYCRFHDAAVWTPTFSTAVFALGCLQVGSDLPSAAFRSIGFAAGLATLVFWALTAGWNLRKCMSSR
ncbi:hypothetical protein [Dyella mobilis]|uniref:Tellurite resistance protein n=2 Tax=Dyella mobilis TaxID=1849582 RepID=A0ABS2KCT4_9GAMM|nr:hypothetical protein [Dyella mobilis]MBM7128979.1 hypothetical protein [Dyella mobilis]